MWVPCYQKEEGLLVLIEKIILKNLALFEVDKRNHKIRMRGNKVQGTNIL